MENIIISNPEEFEQKKKKILEQGVGNLHVLADFDRTLTYAHRENGEKVPSLISVLRDEGYISEDYSEKAKAFAAKYHPIEYDPEIPLDEKKEAMKEWWTSHNKLLVESGLNKKNIERVVDSGIVRLREGAGELMDYLHEKNIPLIILSSSGIGNAIPIFLKKQGKLYDNIHIITNLWEWDENGNAKNMKGPVIHNMNKDETVIHDFPEVYKEIKNRKNVLFLGDSLGDLGMITGFEYDNLVKVGFLNDKVEENLEKYKENFDVVIKNDSDINYVSDIMKEFD